MLSCQSRVRCAGRHTQSSQRPTDSPASSVGQNVMPPRSAAPRRAASLASASTSVSSATATLAAGMTFSVMVNDASTSILLPSCWSILRYTPTRPAYDGSALPPNGYNATCHSQPLTMNPGESILVPGTARSVSAMNLRRTPRGNGIVCRVTERGCGRAIEDRRCHMEKRRRWRRSLLRATRCRRSTEKFGAIGNHRSADFTQTAVLKLDPATPVDKLGPRLIPSHMFEAVADCCCSTFVQFAMDLASRGPYRCVPSTVRLLS